MNQPIHGIPPIPQTPFGTAPTVSVSRIEFADGRSVFRRLVIRGALLELVTIGFYRFWLATDMRRHLWSHTSAEGDAPEYTGTGKELLIGFLFALAILVPLYVAYFLIGIEAERLKAFASIPMVVLYYLFWQFAIYRARRYRLTRTVWRGVRFSMGGSGLSYCWRAALWTLFAVVTLGIALPWRQAALERFKMRHTAYGNLAGRFDATGAQLLKRGWGLWLASMLLVGALVTGFVLALHSVQRGGAEQIVAGLLIIVAGVGGMVALPFFQAMYKAIEWRWWVSGVRFGEVSFESDLGLGRLIGLYWKVIGWGCLITVVFSMVVGAVFALAKSQVGNVPPAQQFLQIMQTPVFYIVTPIAYIGYILAAWTVTRIYMIHDVWKRVASSITVHNLAAAVDVSAQGQMVSALGEGLADSLDIGGL